MLGDLTIAFCEKATDETTKSVEVWAFPDGTLNLVASSASGVTEHEESFPCIPEQLHQIIDGRALRLEKDEASLVVERCGEAVQVHCTSGALRWLQTIDLPVYREGLLQNFALYSVL